LLFDRFINGRLVLVLSGEEWGEFLHVPDKRFYDFNEIRAEIERETDRETGTKKNISNKSINLKIFSPYVLNLSLVDLPGITKVPTGDQPEDVEARIRSMCYDFITNPNAIILAVTAANQDLANSDGLQMARSVDPEGLRTIGVLTKVDIMDRGTDCCDILGNSVIPLRKGYIAVVNRSQQDIINKVPIREGLQREIQYFQAHPKYRAFLSKCSTTNLAKILNQMLMNHIRECLPEIRARINALLAEVQNNMLQLGESIDDLTVNQKGHILLRIVSKFVENFHNLVDGRGSSENGFQTKELNGGARISHIFVDIFAQRLKSLDTFEGLSDADIRNTIANANGIRPSLFVPEISFDILVRKQISKLEQPGLQAVDLVRDELQKMVASSEYQELSRFPDMRDKIVEVANKLLRSCLSPTTEMISNLIRVELAYINTSHPDFVGGKAAASSVSHKLQNAAAPTAHAVVPGNNNATEHAASGAVVRNLENDSFRQNGVGSTNSVGAVAAAQSPQPPGLHNKSGFMGYFQSPNVATTALSSVAHGATPSGISNKIASSGMRGDNEASAIRLPLVSI
jgi:dynamin 1-like protein